MSDILAGITLVLDLSDQRKKKSGSTTKPVKTAKPLPDGKAAPEKATALPKLRFPVENWTPLARVRYVGIQKCAECGRETRYIAGDLIQYYQNDRVGGQRTIRTRAFTAADTRFERLPALVEELTPEHCTCPECLGMNEIFQAVFSHTREIQLPLFL